MVFCCCLKLSLESNGYLSQLNSENCLEFYVSWYCGVQHVDTIKQKNTRHRRTSSSSPPPKTAMSSLRSDLACTSKVEVFPRHDLAS